MLIIQFCIAPSVFSLLVCIRASRYNSHTSNILGDPSIGTFSKAAIRCLSTLGQPVLATVPCLLIIFVLVWATRDIPQMSVAGHTCANLFDLADTKMLSCFDGLVVAFSCSSVLEHYLVF